MTRKENRLGRRRDGHTSRFLQIPGFFFLAAILFGIYLTFTSQTIQQFIHSL